MASEALQEYQEDTQQNRNSIDSQNITICYIGGGSKRWTLKLINDLAQTSNLGGDVLLYDVNYKGAKRNERFGNWVQDRDDAEGDWTYTAVTDRAQALSNADFVLLSTQYPTRATFKHDLEIPKSFDVYQAVAVTIGPGGILRAMRTIPVYRELAGAIREHCPDAWVLNYTNPVTMVTRALYEEYPDINAIGLCHEVFHLQELLADLVGTYYDVEQPDRDEIDLNVKGINHFTWADEAQWNGRDLFALLDRHIEEEGVVREYTPEEMADESGFVDNNQVTYELYRRFGVVPAAGDRHLVEFTPWFLQGELPEDLLKWGVKRTTSGFRVSRWEDELNEDELGTYLDENDEITASQDVAKDVLRVLSYMKDVYPWKNDPDEIERYMRGQAEFDFVDSGEVIVDVLEALTGVKSYKTNVNLPNAGQMRELPDGAVVETNALLTGNNIKPLVAGTLPRPIHTQIMTHVHNQETIIEAAFSGYDIDHAFRAFLNDPQVKTLQIGTARDLFAELVAAERQYLDEWNLENSDVMAESDTISL